MPLRPGENNPCCSFPDPPRLRVAAAAPYDPFLLINVLLPLLLLLLLLLVVVSPDGAVSAVVVAVYVQLMRVQGLQCLSAHQGPLQSVMPR